ncbi:MAG: hypothetical protein KGQ93_00175 [Cyanobacteria bacterium REEB459]|nr:hypothetical protein [Cyanobacteria bacterium REEB459]
MEESKASKVTLYLPSQTHRQLKIHSAVEGEAMSAIAQRAIDFYLANPDLVAQGIPEGRGQTHRIYDCPCCAVPLVLKDTALVEVVQLSSCSDSPTLAEPGVPGLVIESNQLGEGELVPC